MASSSDLIKSAEYDVIKSANDTRNYGVLELANGMRVLLISDPETDKSSAALDVHVGTMSDPDDIPGLAHLCEHMLFLGNLSLIFYIDVKYTFNLESPPISPDCLICVSFKWDNLSYISFWGVGVVNQRNERGEGQGSGGHEMYVNTLHWPPFC